MIVIPFAMSDETYNIFIALGDDSLERIRQYDPAQVQVMQMGPGFITKRLRTILVGYASAEDLEHIVGLSKAGDPGAILKYLSRGFAFQPEKGDYDGPPLSLLDKEGEKSQ